MTRTISPCPASSILFVINPHFLVTRYDKSVLATASPANLRYIKHARFTGVFALKSRFDCPTC